MFIFKNIPTYLPKFIDKYFVLTDNPKDVVTCRHFVFFLKVYIIFYSSENFYTWFYEFERNYYYDSMHNFDLYPFVLENINFIKRHHPKNSTAKIRILWFGRKFTGLKFKHWYFRPFFFFLNVYRAFRIWYKWRFYNFCFILILIYLVIFLYLLIRLILAIYLY